MPPEADTGTQTGAEQQQQQAPWHAGADADTLGYMQNRGWQDKPANEVALEAIKAHREASAMLGVPPDRIVKLPADASDEAGWKAVWEKLGKPADAKEYDFSAVKVGETALTQADQDYLRGLANDLNLSKEGAARLASDFAKRQTDAGASNLADQTAKLVEEKTKLATNWGPNAEANMYVAKQTALKLGVTPDQVQALENQIGYAGVMEMFRNIGQKTGEASFVGNGQEFNKGVMTKEQAVARKAELMNDSAWTSRYQSGDAQANRELQALLVIMHGDDTERSRNS